MSFISVVVDDSAVSDRLLFLFALFNRPSLFLDCSNCADVFAVSDFVDFEFFDSVFIYEIEMLYKLRDVVYELDSVLSSFSFVCVSSLRHLFNYDNSSENLYVYFSVFSKLSFLSYKFNIPIVICVVKGSLQERIAKVHCDFLIKGDDFFPYFSKKLF